MGDLDTDETIILTDQIEIVCEDMDLIPVTAVTEVSGPAFSKLCILLQKS